MIYVHLLKKSAYVDILSSWCRYLAIKYIGKDTTLTVSEPHTSSYQQKSKNEIVSRIRKNHIYLFNSWLENKLSPIIEVIIGMISAIFMWPNSWAEFYNKYHFPHTSLSWNIWSYFFIVRLEVKYLFYLYYLSNLWCF